MCKKTSKVKEEKQRKEKRGEGKRKREGRGRGRKKREKRQGEEKRGEKREDNKVPSKQTKGAETGVWRGVVTTGGIRRRGVTLEEGSG